MENFEDAISEEMTTPMFVRLWARYCVHCREMTPHWTKLAEMPEFEGKVDFAEIDCEAEPKICKAFPGSGVPRVFWVEKGNASQVQYFGDKELQHLASFVRKQLSYPLILIENASEIENYSAEAAPVFVYTAPNDDEATYALAKDIAEELRSYECNFLLMQNATERSLEARYGLTAKYDGEFNKDEMIVFIKKHSVKYMSNLTVSTMIHLEDNNITFLAVINPSETSYEALRDASLLLPVLYTNCSEDDWFCYFAGQVNSSYAVYRNEPRSVWVMKGHPGRETTREWIKSILGGQLKGVSPRDPPLEVAYYRAQAKRNKLSTESLLFVCFALGVVAIIVINDIKSLCAGDEPGEKEKSE